MSVLVTRASETPLRTIISMLALLFAFVAMIFLITSNVRLMTRIGEEKSSVDQQSPVFGALAGWSAQTSSEWVANSEASDGGILFPISRPAGAGSFSYWKNVAARLRAIVPSARIVGLCLHDKACDDSLYMEHGFTVLEAMDPAFANSLAGAAKHEQIFLLRGSRVVGTIPMSEDIEHLSQQIASRLLRTGDADNT